MYYSNPQKIHNRVTDDCSSRYIKFKKAIVKYWLPQCGFKKENASKPYFVILLIVFISLITNQSKVFAQKAQSAEELRRQAFTQQQLGNLDKALALYAQAAGLSPDQANLFNDIGVVYDQMGLLDKAEAAYLEALGLDKDYLPPYMNLAFLYRKKGDTAQAIEYFQKRIDAGKSGDPWIKKAKQEIAKTLDQFPEFKEKLIRAQAEQFNRELIEEEQKKAAQVWGLDLSKANAHFESGMKFLDKKEYKPAVEEFEKALVITPNNPKVTKVRDEARLALIEKQVQQHSEHAMELLRKGDSLSAREEIQKILTLIPSEPVPPASK